MNVLPGSRCWGDHPGALLLLKASDGQGGPIRRWLFL